MLNILVTSLGTNVDYPGYHPAFRDDNPAHPSPSDNFDYSDEYFDYPDNILENLYDDHCHPVVSHEYPCDYPGHPGI